MIDMAEIEDEIAKLEHSETSWRNCERLHILYAVRDQYGSKAQSVTAEKPYTYADSEFALVAIQTDKEKLIEVLDEHFEIIKQIYPKEYRAVIKKMREI